MDWNGMLRPRPRLTPELEERIRQSFDEASRMEVQWEQGSGADGTVHASVTKLRADADVDQAWEQEIERRLRSPQRSTPERCGATGTIRRRRYR